MYKLEIGPETMKSIYCNGGVTDPRAGDANKPSNPKDAAATNRIDLTLFPDTAVFYGALAMTEGDQKYGGYNYRLAGVNASVYVSACRRHLAKWYNGEDSDPDTGVPHLASALACIGVLIDSHVHGNLNDDRPPKSDIGRLTEEMNAAVAKLKDVFPAKAARITNDSTPRSAFAFKPGRFESYYWAPPVAECAHDVGICGSGHYQSCINGQC
jgi:hypothetical protein